jgi:outer membrane protein
MKKVLVMTVVSLFMVVGFAFAQENGKVGYVEMKKALNASKAGKAALAQLDKTAAEKQGGIAKEKKKLEDLQADYEKKSASLTDKERIANFQKLVEKTQQEFGDTQAEFTKKVYKEMKKAIAEIAKAENFSLVIEKTDTSVLFSKDELDLTDRVIEKMNAK